MKILAFMSLFLPAAYAPSDFSPAYDTAVRGDMRVDRMVDKVNGVPVVCYMAQHNNGSSHTTPAIDCLKL